MTCAAEPRNAAAAAREHVRVLASHVRVLAPHLVAPRTPGEIVLQMSQRRVLLALLVLILKTPSAKHPTPGKGKR